MISIEIQRENNFVNKMKKESEVITKKNNNANHDSILKINKYI